MNAILRTVSIIAVFSVMAMTTTRIYADLVANVVGLQPVSVTTTNELGGYEATYTIDRADYTSGVTTWAVIEALAYDSTNYHTDANPVPGSITWDLGSVFAMDRVRIDWTNGGGGNNFSDFTLLTSMDSSFTSPTLVYTNLGDPTSSFEPHIDFTTVGTGQFVRLSWTSTQGTYGGLREIVVGGAQAIPEPASASLILLVGGLFAFLRTRHRSKTAS